MSHPTAAGSRKRPPDAPVNDAQHVAQRARVDTESGGEGAAASASPSLSPALSPAQRCAADTLAAAFSFLSFRELAPVLRVCRGWLAAADKERPRGLEFYFVHLFPALCASSSALRRHFSSVDATASYSNLDFSLSLEQLRLMSRLPFLTEFQCKFDSAELQALLAQGHASALSQLQAAFPPRLETLALTMSWTYGPAPFQLQLDLLPSLSRLTSLDLRHLDSQDNAFASISLDPLLQLSQLDSLTFRVRMGGLSIAQLGIIKQIDSLTELHTPEMDWSVEQLAALCRPPHRLQQLEEFDLGRTVIDAAQMAELVHLPALTELSPRLRPSAYPSCRVSRGCGNCGSIWSSTLTHLSARRNRRLWTLDCAPARYSRASPCGEAAAPRPSARGCYSLCPTFLSCESVVALCLRCVSCNTRRSWRICTSSLAPQYDRPI